jgi:hypothetical protein
MAFILLLGIHIYSTGGYVFQTLSCKLQGFVGILFRGFSKVCSYMNCILEFLLFLQKGETLHPPPPETAKKSRILGLKSSVLLTFDGKFWAKRGVWGGPLGPPLNLPLSVATSLYLYPHKYIKMSPYLLNTRRKPTT